MACLFVSQKKCRYGALSGLRENLPVAVVSIAARRISDSAAAKHRESMLSLMEQLDPVKRKPLTMIQRIKEFPDGAKKLLRDFSVYKDIHDAANTPRNAWTRKHDDILLSRKLEDLPPGRIPRRQYEQQRRIRLDGAAILPVVVLAMMPIVGYVPMVLAFLSPRQILSRHFINDYEVLKYCELAFAQRKQHFAAVYEFVLRKKDDPTGSIIDFADVYARHKADDGSVGRIFPALDEFAEEYLQRLALAIGVLQHLPHFLSTKVVHVAPKTWLVHQIRLRIESVTTDDSLLLYEGHHKNGCESLTDIEVMDACLERSLPVTLAPWRLRTNLTDHLEIVAGLRDVLPPLYVESEDFGLLSIQLPILRQAAKMAMESMDKESKRCFEKLNPLLTGLRGRLLSYLQLNHR